MSELAKVSERADVGAKFVQLIDDPSTTYEALRTFVDGLAPSDRRAAIYRAGGVKRQARLWKLAEAGPSIQLEQLIPEDATPLKPVIFYGKNSLIPPFTVFQKPMCRQPDGQLLMGYNYGWTGFITGPGFFVVRNSTEDEIGPVAVDYTQLPETKPDEWPKIRTNKYLLSRFVYHNMVDYLREVGTGMLIGRAVKKGKITSNYFLLAREH